MKANLYKELIARMDAAQKHERHLEASWYAYAVIEDRLRSMLLQSGGDTFAKGKNKGKQIRMMGPKMEILETRSSDDALLDSAFEGIRLKVWRESRNDLMHAMASGQHSIDQIDKLAKKLASDGVKLARVYATSARWLKKHRAKVAATPSE